VGAGWKIEEPGTGMGRAGLGSGVRSHASEWGTLTLGRMIPRT